jgi:hypothetical protein
MTQMGLEYQKYKESKRHNIEQEGIGKREVGVKEYTASFEPRRVGATEAQAQASLQNASTNKYLASFENRKVRATETQAAASQKQASASMKQANVQEAKYQLDAKWRRYEEELKAKELQIKSAANEVKRYAENLKSLPASTRAALAAQGLNMSTADQLAMVLDQVGTNVSSFIGSAGKTITSFTGSK